MSEAHVNMEKRSVMSFFGHKHYPIQVIAPFLFFCQMILSFIAHFFDTKCYLLMK